MINSVTQLAIVVRSAFLHLNRHDIFLSTQNVNTSVICITTSVQNIILKYSDSYTLKIVCF